MSWTVISHEHHERSADWYWTLGVGALAVIVISIFFGNLLFAVVIALGSASIGFLAARGPREHTVYIDNRGLSIDGTRYPFSAIHSFWVEHEAEDPRLFMTMRGVLAPHFSLELDDQSQAEVVRTHLKQHVAEEEQGPHVGEHLAQIFGL